MIQRLIAFINVLWNLSSKLYNVKEKLENLVIVHDEYDSVTDVKRKLLKFYTSLCEFHAEFESLKDSAEGLRDVADDLVRHSKQRQDPEGVFILNGIEYKGKLKAIKAVRELRPTWGLKEAKDWVEEEFKLIPRYETTLVPMFTPCGQDSVNGTDEGV